MGIAPNTARSWLSILEASGLVGVVEPWTRNRTSRLIRTPKVYFADTGLLCYLIGIQSVQQLRESALLGAVWETWAFMQLSSWFHYRGESHPPIYYWRTKDGPEVDFVVESGDRVIAIEYKARERVTDDDARGMNLLAAAVGPKVGLRRAFFAMVREPYPARDRHLDNGAGLTTSQVARAIGGPT